MFFIFFLTNPFPRRVHKENGTVLLTIKSSIVWLYKRSYKRLLDLHSEMFTWLWFYSYLWTLPYGFLTSPQNTELFPVAGLSNSASMRQSTLIHVIYLCVRDVCGGWLLLLSLLWWRVIFFWLFMIEICMHCTISTMSPLWWIFAWTGSPPFNHRNWRLNQVYECHNLCSYI